MHISYRHDEPEVIVKDIGEINLLIEALTDLRAEKMSAMVIANRDLGSSVAPEDRFTPADFGIDKIDAMLATMEEVL